MSTLSTGVTTLVSKIAVRNGTYIFVPMFCTVLHKISEVR